MKRRLFSILTALALLLGLCPIGALAADTPAEQFPGLSPGETCWFDLSGAGIPGTVNAGNGTTSPSVPDTTLHWVPFTYVGTINAYKLESPQATTEEYATENACDHSLFIANYNVTHTVSWNDLNGQGLIFGTAYASGGVDYTLRAPSAGSSSGGAPQNNEWTSIIDKNFNYIKNWRITSLGQDTSRTSTTYFAIRGRNQARMWDTQPATARYSYAGFRPVLELPSPAQQDLGLKTVTVDLNGGSIGSTTGSVKLAASSGSSFPAPSGEGLTRPAGNTLTAFAWRGDDGNYYAPGAAVPAGVNRLTAVWAKEPTPAITISYEDEALTGFEAGGSYTINGAAVTPTGGTLAVGSYTGQTISIVRKGDGSATADSGPQSLALPARPAAPTGLGSTNASSAGASDGAITGVSTAMEYSADGSSWTACTGTEITGLAAGTYQVRAKATDRDFASQPSSVDVELSTYTLSVADLTFETLTYGYAQPAPKAITISCTGNSAATITGVAVSGSAFTVGGSGSTVPAGGSIATWTVQPNAGLDTGTHTATVTVAYDGGATATAEVRFTVEGLAQDAPAAPVEKGKTHNSVTLEAVADNANGAKAQYSKDNGATWQDSPEFAGLSANTAYSFVVRYGAIGGYSPSPASPATRIATSSPPAPPSTPAYPVTVHGGTGGGSYRAGATVTVTATVPEGKRFTGWTVDVGGVALANSATAAFTMPAQAVTVTANFEDLPALAYPVTVNNGTGGGDYTAGATVTVTATVPKGKRFTGWTVDAGGVTLANSATAAFTMPAQAVTVTANFEDLPSGSGPSSGGNWPSGGGSSSGGGSPAPAYPPTVVQPSEGGSVTVSASRPGQGDTVTVTPAPENGYEVAGITVTAQDGTQVEVKANRDGTYSFVQPSGKVKIEVSYRPAGPVETEWANRFTDISEGKWYYGAVRYVQENGLMDGYGNGAFGPDDILSRAQLTQILYNRAGKPNTSGGSAFADVANGAWYAGAIAWAAQSGIVDGYGNGAFGPNDPITREQLAVMLWRYAGSPTANNKELHFTDADEASGYALEALCWAVENGVLNGYGDGRLDPKGQATRAQVAQVLANFLKHQ